ncbi:MAG TPA: M15 family metallopeptidase [Trichocoleus sp.]|jgi:D-alanyl-D-alanine carboxypeptidase
MQEDLRVNDAGLPKETGELSEFSNAPIQDIPEAVRETSGTEKSGSRRYPLILWAFGSGVVASIGLVSLALMPRSLSQAPALTATSAAETIMAQAIDLFGGEGASTLLGHLRYKEAPQNDLQPVSSNTNVLLRRSAASKFQAMMAAAKADGVTLVPLSGFRSIAEQEHVFFDLKAERGQDVNKRASVSAPPGYSEHHTGYAVDIGDGERSSSDLQPSFDATPAYRWLKQNAAFYSFELSFSKDNPMNVSYEPWHWRFVGDRESLETFYRARMLSEEGKRQ